MVLVGEDYTGLHPIHMSHMAKIMRIKWRLEKEKGQISDYKSALIPDSAISHTDSLLVQSTLSSWIELLNIVPSVSTFNEIPVERPSTFWKENYSSHHKMLVLLKNLQLSNCWKGSFDQLIPGISKHCSIAS